jgi:type II secretory pathway pseudopilin PulG
VGVFPIHRRISSEAGIGLIESVITLAVAAIILLSLTYSILSALGASRSSKLFLQATSLGNEAVESARDLAYEALIMVNADLAGDARVVGSCSGLSGTYFYDPDGTGPLSCEAIVSSDSGGSIFPHVTTETVGTSQFSVSRYVTWVDEDTQGGVGQDYKRIAVIVEWTVNSEPLSYETSAFVTRARRGLPIPKFELAPPDQTHSVEPGNIVAVPFTTHNLGITDAYDLSLPSPGGRLWTVAFYHDVNEDGVYNPTQENLAQLLTDTNGTGTVDTGNVLTGETVFLLAVWTLSPVETNGTEDMVLTATSGADDTIFHEVLVTVEVGTVGIALYLHDNPTPPTGDSTANINMAMNPTAPTATTLYQYSSNYYNGAPGRYVKEGTAGPTTTTNDLISNWVYQVPEVTNFNGTGEIDLWVALKDFKCDKTLVVNYWVREKNSANTSAGTILATGAMTWVPSGSEPCNWVNLTTTFAISRIMPQNRWVELKIAVATSTGTAGLFAYDTTTYQSKLTLPQVAS